MCMKAFLRNNGLSLTLLAFFLLLWFGQSVAGFYEQAQTARDHHRLPESYAQYLTSGHFLEATFENWESEFLQMGAYVILTAVLFQRGSAESRDPDAKPSPRVPTENSPGILRRGGWRLRLYEHSLSLTFLAIFLLCLSGHALAGYREYNVEQVEHGQPPVSLGEYLSGSRFWFESLQNWQSEFLAVAAIVILSIWLREKGSPESKHLVAPHNETGR